MDTNDLARIFSDMDDAGRRLAGALADPAAATAARELALGFAALAEGCREEARTSAAPDELVIDDDGPRAGVMRPVEPTDYALDRDRYGRRPENLHYAARSRATT